MKTSSKAALYSAFIYPGAGQLYLKQYFPASIFIAIASIALGVLIFNAAHIANAISGQIVSGQIDFNIATILELVQQQSAAQSSKAENATMALIITWICALFDSLRLGKKRNKS